jgi:hypothetical protein
MTTPDAEQGLVLHDGQRLPSTPSLLKLLKQGLDSVLLEIKTKVETPEDSYAGQRRLAEIAETAKSYGRAFTTFERSSVRPAIAELLIDAVGEQDGVPTSGITVPDIDGTNIKISVDTENDYEIDQDSLRSALAFALITERADRLGEMFRAEFDGDPETVRHILAEVLVQAMESITAQGAFKPQITKVRATAKLLARLPGGDKIAATVTGAIKKTVKFKGISVDREQA